jgi:hypothetical protein
MSEYDIHAGFRGPQVPGATLGEALRADLEAALGVTFSGDAGAPSPSFTWGDGDCWLSVWVAVPPDLDEPHRSHPARVSAVQTDTDAFAHRVFEALDGTGRYSLFMIEDHEDLVRTNSHLARTQWDEAHED